MNQRDTYAKKIHAQLDELNLSLSDLEKTVKEKSSEAHSAYANEMQGLRQKLSEIRNKLDLLKKASDENWHNMVEHIEILQHALIAAYNCFKSEVKKNELQEGLPL